MMSNEIDQPEAPCEGRAGTRSPRLCFEVCMSRLPPLYRDRISPRQRTCWVELPEPSSARPGYFQTRIGRTPDQLSGKRPVFLTEAEAAALTPSAQAPVPVVKVAPAYLLPETLRLALCPGSFDEFYLLITDRCFTDERQGLWRMVYISVFPDRLTGWRSGPVHTLWLLQQQIDQAMPWSRDLSSLDAHTLRVCVSDYARERGAVAPQVATPQPAQTGQDPALSASQNLFIPREATDGLLAGLAPGQDGRRSQEQGDILFGLPQETWLTLGLQAAMQEREQRARAGRYREARRFERVAACIRQVQGWYGRRRSKRRILGICGVFVEDRGGRASVPPANTRGKQARSALRFWAEEPAPRLVGYQLVIGAPPWVGWPQDWAQKPRQERLSA